MTGPRSRAGSACIVTLVIAAVLAFGAQPNRAEAVGVPGPCDVPGVSLVCSAAGDVASATAGAAGGAVLGQLTSWVGDGASWLLLQVAAAINTTTSVDLSAPWFHRHYAFMFQAGAILLLPLLLLTVLQAVLRQDAGLLLRVGLLHLPAAMLMTGLAVSVTQTALAVTDALSAELTAGVAKNTHTLATTLTQTSAVGGTVPLFASFLLALVMALAAICVWFELVLRAGVVYIAVMFLPLFLATMIWPVLSGWVRRLAQLIVAAILSKLVIVATLSLGLSALTSGDGASAVLAGAGMFLLAAFSPFVLFSLIPLAAEIAQPQREARRAVATTTGASLAWSAARTRMSSGAMVGAGSAFALGSGTMATAAGGAAGGGGSVGPPGVPAPAPAGGSGNAGGAPIAQPVAASPAAPPPQPQARPASTATPGPVGPLPRPRPRQGNVDGD